MCPGGGDAPSSGCQGTTLGWGAPQGGGGVDGHATTRHIWAPPPLPAWLGSDRMSQGLKILGGIAPPFSPDAWVPTWSCQLPPNSWGWGGQQLFGGNSWGGGGEHPGLRGRIPSLRVILPEGELSSQLFVVGFPIISHYFPIISHYFMIIRCYFPIISHYFPVLAVISALLAIISKLLAIICNY